MKNTKNVYVEKDGNKTTIGKAITKTNGEILIILDTIPVNGILKIENKITKNKNIKKEK